MTVRFKQPVYEGEELRIEARETGGKRLAITVEQGRAEGVAWLCDTAAQVAAREWVDAPAPGRESRRPASADVFRPGTALGSIVVQVNLADAAVSRPLPAAIGESRCAHPAVLLSLANDLLIHNVVLGPWIHVSSEVTNFAAVHDGEPVTVRGVISETFERKGHEFATIDVIIESASGPALRSIHTVIWRLRQPA
jgi:acyl dehydratase